MDRRKYVGAGEKKEPDFVSIQSGMGEVRFFHITIRSDDKVKGGHRIGVP